MTTDSDSRDFTPRRARRRGRAGARRLRPALRAACVLSALLSSTHALPAQTRPHATKPAGDFQEAKPVVNETTREAEAFEFELRGFAYHVTATGNGRREKRGDRTRRFNLRLDAGRLERLYYADDGGRLLLVCGADDVEQGGGFVTLLEQPSMRARWRRTYPGHNVGRPLREGRSLYVTGVGFVGRINLDTGEFDWRHDGLYDGGGSAPDSFAAFEVPELAGDAVLFRDKPVYNPRKTLVVNKRSGEIIRVE